MSMFWPVLAIAAVAIALIKLGALSVWVTVLSLTLKFIALAAVVVLVAYLVHRYRKSVAAK